jgi:hypothetical protein
MLYNLMPPDLEALAWSLGVVHNNPCIKSAPTRQGPADWGNEREKNHALLLSSTISRGILFHLDIMHDILMTYSCSLLTCAEFLY